MNESDTIQSLPGVGWHHEDVKAALRKRFGSLSAVAKAFCVSRQSISGALLNPLASAKLERLIADALDVHPHAIWPTRWMANGKPIPRSERSRMVRKVHFSINKRNDK